MTLSAPPDFSPISDLSSKDIPHLLLGQLTHPDLGMDHDSDAVHSNGMDVQIRVLGRLILL